ncbi:MAG: hypothetical protein LBC04_02190 [Holosporaceae bacterium]|jgi:hypothetical protein|nr:hypothetical protein [Holosporaceae bacterium]
MKKVVFLFAFLCVNVDVTAMAINGVMAMSAASSLKTLSDSKSSFFGEIFSSKGGLALEEVMLSVEENMNNNGAVKMHIVIVYEKELLEELMKMSAEEYFRHIKQLTKDHPDKMKIFEWELVAKKRIMPWKKLDYPADNMTPLAGIIFAKYHGTEVYRERISADCEKIKITFESDNFHVECPPNQ